MKYPLRSDKEIIGTKIEEDWGNLCWLASQENGNALGLTLGRITVKCDQSTPRHCHPNCEEVIYLLRGKLKHTVGDETIMQSQGDTLTVPKGVFHHSTCIEDLDADMIVVYSAGKRGYKTEE